MSSSPAEYHLLPGYVDSTEVPLWPHSLPSHLASLPASDGAPWAAPGVVPWLVLELARSQLKSLLVEASPAFSASVVEEEAEEESWEQLRADVDGRP